MVMYQSESSRSLNLKIKGMSRDVVVFFARHNKVFSQFRDPDEIVNISLA